MSGLHLGSLLVLAWLLVPASMQAQESSLEPGAQLDPAPWSHLHAKDVGSDFDFVVVSDRTGSHREGVFRQAMAKINLVQPAFVVSVGDLIEGYTDDPEELDRQWDEMAEIVAQLEAPFFYAAGNHDMSNEVMTAQWKSRFGPSYYSFVYKDVLFIVLNSELFGMVSNPSKPVPGPEKQEEQMNWLAGVLEENVHRRHSFVLLHQPLWDRRTPHPDWERVEKWLGDREYTVLAGHHHSYTQHVRHGRNYLTLGTTGGGSRLRGLDRGEFDHVLMVSMRGHGPILANLLLDGIYGEDVRTSDTRMRLGLLEGVLKPVEGKRVGILFEEADVAYEIYNSTEEAYRVEAEFVATDGFRVRPERIRLDVAPGEEKRIQLRLEAAEPKDLRSARLPVGHWRLTAKKADGSNLTVESDAWVLPLARFEIPPAPAEVAVDGRIDEWDQLPYRVDPTGGREGATHYRFAVAYDADFLYLAVEVKDSTPAHSEQWVARKQDAVQVTVDARPDPERSRAGEEYIAAIMAGSLRDLQVYYLTPVESKFDDLTSRWLTPAVAGVRQAGRKTATGYVTELAIPSAWLNQRQGGPWQAVRLEVSVNDAQEPGQDPEAIPFRPSRFDSGGPLPAPGTSIFERAGAGNGSRGRISSFSSAGENSALMPDEEKPAHDG